MAVIQKRIGRNGAISYRVMIRRKGFAPVYETHKKLTDAKAAARKAETAIDEGTGVIVGAARRHTLGDAIKKFTETVIANRDDQSTKRHYQFWTERLGHARLRNITPDMIVAARDHLLKTESRLGKPLAPATVKLYIESLSAVFKTAREDWPSTRSNPHAQQRGPRPRPSKGQVRVLRQRQRAAALLDVCGGGADPGRCSLVLPAISAGAPARRLTGLDMGRCGPRSAPARRFPVRT